MQVRGELHTTQQCSRLQKRDVYSLQGHISLARVCTYILYEIERRRRRRRRRRTRTRGGRRKRRRQEAKVLSDMLLVRLKIALTGSTRDPADRERDMFARRLQAWMEHGLAQRGTAGAAGACSTQLMDPNLSMGNAVGSKTEVACMGKDAEREMCTGNANAVFKPEVSCT